VEIVASTDIESVALHFACRVWSNKFVYMLL